MGEVGGGVGEVGGEGVGEGVGGVWEGENSFLEKCLSPFQVSNPISGLKKQKN